MTQEPTYSHAYDFAFEVSSKHNEADDVTPAMLRSALIKRATALSDAELTQACGRYDSYQEDSPHE